MAGKYHAIELTGLTREYLKPRGTVRSGGRGEGRP